MTATGQCDFLTPVDDGVRRLIGDMPFQTRYGLVVVPDGFPTNLFSVVPDTKYPDFWKASILHDFMYSEIRKKNPDRTIQKKRHADQAFYDEMLIQSAVIFGKLQYHVGTAMAVDEFHKLLKLSKLYYRGVSGLLGRIYQIFAD